MHKVEKDLTILQEGYAVDNRLSLFIIVTFTNINIFKQPFCLFNWFIKYK